MKLVKLTAADVDKLRKALPATQPPPHTFHHEELKVDSLSIALARPSDSKDPRTNAYSIGFRCEGSEYVVVVRPTVHDMPSITLNILRKGEKEGSDVEFSSYTVLQDTVTTLQGQVSGPLAGQITAPGGDLATADLDLPALLGHFKVR